MMPADEDFVADRIEDALSHIAAENDAAREHLRSALAELNPDRAAERRNHESVRGP